MARTRYCKDDYDGDLEMRVLSVRVPVPVAQFIDSCVGKPDLPTRAAVLFDALVHWCIEEERNA